VDDADRGTVTTVVADGGIEVVGDPEARYPIYSVTKTVVAAAVLLLVREGVVELDSVRSLLDHTSGVRDYGSLSEYHDVGFWRNLPAEMLEPRTFVPIGFDAPGFVRPCYGLGVMADPENPLGAVVGHGGGGPGYAAAVFAAPRADTVAIVLAADESYPAQETALELLTAAVRGRR
jgi:CubicO group peptidase (beta-lactamase class C family)